MKELARRPRSLALALVLGIGSIAGTGCGVESHEDTPKGEFYDGAYYYPNSATQERVKAECTGDGNKDLVVTNVKDWVEDDEGLFENDDACRGDGAVTPEDNITPQVIKVLRAGLED
jgi:hypothetical protein